ncbi:ABC transporter ATP-binding protein [Quadrisphaera sp. DSM 44207]|uniref:ABC transporter ATP-binding protein n=1 Tax=Quadrisphaera sp. DSM 44207 TaxID=1881057 RepID=UPI000890B7ED|nr:ABC transporter ATP-binding protein [Quadrisphaera sp. DSM 44207]SDQ40699.1 peptide/nickel transport system ATP-binding protein [Quadrisphaera sp. DSM 44207]
MSAPAPASAAAGSGAAPLLSVRDLRVVFAARGRRPVHAVDGVSFDVRPGEVMGLVGESGSGKSVTSLAVTGLLPRRAARVSGQALLDGRDLLALPQRRLDELRGRDVAMVFQDPMTSLNPVVPVGLQITEVLRRHTPATRAQARERAVELLARVGIPDPRRRVREFPHQLSGGMRQRVMIAIALACSPRLLIADEPTTALDVTIQAQVLELLKELVVEQGTAMVLITHDLGVVAGLCDAVTVMYSGRVVERAGRRELFAHPRHRYTAGLLAAVPRLDAPRDAPLRPIPGTPRDVLAWADGCAFAPRCPAAAADCLRADLALVPDPDGGADGGADGADGGADGGAVGHEMRCVHPVPEPGHDQGRGRAV